MSNLVLVKVRDMEIGHTYIVDKEPKELVEKDLEGYEGSTKREPYFTLNFKDNEGNITTKINQEWDKTYNEVKSGGKRKSKRYNRKSNKSRRNRRKSIRRR